jgi:hypothetical protein
MLVRGCNGVDAEVEPVAVPVPVLVVVVPVAGKVAAGLVVAAA